MVSANPLLRSIHCCWCEDIGESDSGSGSSSGSNGDGDGGEGGNGEGGGQALCVCHGRGGWWRSFVERFLLEAKLGFFRGCKKKKASTPDVLTGEPALGLDYTVLCYG